MVYPPTTVVVVSAAAAAATMASICSKSESKQDNKTTILAEKHGSMSCAGSIAAAQLKSWLYPMIFSCLAHKIVDVRN